MKANELRIGNYVNADGNYKKVYNLYSNGWDFLHDDIDCRFVEYQNTKPIPLTEEWLLKFGFEKTNESKEVEWYVFNGFEVSTYNEGETVYFVYQHLVLRHIVSVHQLQNLFFALTNKELTLKL